MESRNLLDALALLRAAAHAYCLRLRCALVIRTGYYRAGPADDTRDARRKSGFIFMF
ncbi:hypothetical protein EMCLV133L [Equine molluscum contagiosum-like virus]|nr:hypothetical protein EMCLV133L [Equine molluscum contagiosum-like virus]